MSFLQFVFLLLLLSVAVLRSHCSSTLPQNEVDILNEIASTMGANDWKFSASICEEEIGPFTSTDPIRNVTCSCEFENNTCHVIAIAFKRYNLTGVLSPKIVELPYLQYIDFSKNYLNGSIPLEWASMKLKKIALYGNRLSGSITHLGNITSLTYLDLDINQFSGTIPAEFGKLINLETLRLSSNNFSGNLPGEFAELRNLTFFEINNNNLNGSIPDFIQNWKQLDRLEMQGSGLQGPIPSSISVLENLVTLKLIGINGKDQAFPMLANNSMLRRLVLSNCNISGVIPAYIWELNNLRILDLSFNKLTGDFNHVTAPANIVFLFLTSNFFTGDIPVSLLRTGSNVDLSYNTFNWPSPEDAACTKVDLNRNFFRSFSRENNLGGVFPCQHYSKCERYSHSLHINCGGDNVKVNGTTYIGDAQANDGVATLYINNNKWGFSSSGDFMEDNNELNTLNRFIASVTSSNIPEIDTTARLSPLSLTYYHYCLRNGSYTVSLHFTEIQYTTGESYGALGRRVFDIYIQDELVEKNFDIEAEAHGLFIPITKKYNITVTNNTLEIRFCWAGKGTEGIPVLGVYGPLISAISVDPNFKPPSGRPITTILEAALSVVGFLLILSAVGILWWRCHQQANLQKRDLQAAELQTICTYSLKQIKAATDNFDPANKIGEGGFGSVYKGLLPDGTVIAVKQLSAKSTQGNREFLNEMGMISCLQHPNLVKLFGCCTEGNQLLLIYEYLENNCLSRALFGSENGKLDLNWSTRQNICLGIARGLAYLHEESRLKVVHRDIKGTNILLDSNLNPKISDFGLAKLHEVDKTHISTRIAGTIGYIAPEYALWGYLTYKADVYSFGIVALEIVTGKRNTDNGPDSLEHTCLLEWACHLLQNGDLSELVDENLNSEFDKEEAERMIKVALLCTDITPSQRPMMSEVVKMLEGKASVPDKIPESGSMSQDLRFKAIRDHQKHTNNQNSHSGSTDDSLLARYNSDTLTERQRCNTSMS